MINLKCHVGSGLIFIKISETYYIQFGEVKGFEVDILIQYL